MPKPEKKIKKTNIASVKVTKPSKPKPVSIAEYTRRRNIWLKALEEGRLKQTKSVLHSYKLSNSGKKDSSFCCLGVACKLFRTELDIERSERLKTFAYNSDEFSLPEKLEEYLGFHTNAGGSGRFSRPIVVEPESGLTAVSLAELNDHHDFTFKQIAKVIRNNPHLLWKKGTYNPLKKKLAKAKSQKKVVKKSK